MIFIVTAENRAFFQDELDEMYRQRKQVFVDRCGWRIPVVNDMEIDGYDRDDTIYLLAKAAPEAPIVASVRLLSTVGPHLMADLFRETCASVQPRGPAVWEVSRFCISPEVQSRRTRLGLIWDTVCGVSETALLFGIERVTFATHGALLRLVLGCGWQAEPLGSPLLDGEERITAVAASITPDGLDAVRRRFGVPRPVTRFCVPGRSTACWHGAFQ